MKAQEFKGEKYTTMNQATLKIFREEGVRGLWAGNGANVLRVIPVYALKFSFNDSFKDLVRRDGQKSLDINQLVRYLNGIFSV